MHYEQVLKFDPSAAPEGDCFDPKTPDRAFEQQYFPSWYNEITPWGYGTYRNMDSLMRIARDETVDGNVLEWTHSCLRYFVCDDRFVSDFQASATLRSVQPHFEGYHDIPGCDVSRLGIVFRGSLALLKPKGLLGVDPRFRVFRVVLLVDPLSRPMAYG